MKFNVSKFYLSKNKTGKNICLGLESDRIFFMTLKERNMRQIFISFKGKAIDNQSTEVMNKLDMWEYHSHEPFLRNLLENDFLPL